MNQNLWEIVKGIEKSPRDRNKLLEWKNRDNKTKSIVGLALSDLELYHTDLEKSSKVIWDNLNETNKVFSHKLSKISGI
jgi:hypothetical protein